MGMHTANATMKEAETRLVSRAVCGSSLLEMNTGIEETIRQAMENNIQFHLIVKILFKTTFMTWIIAYQQVVEYQSHEPKKLYTLHIP
jgi:hypothetical protein